MCLVSGERDDKLGDLSAWKELLLQLCLLLVRGLHTASFLFLLLDTSCNDLRYHLVWLFFQILDVE